MVIRNSRVRQSIKVNIALGRCGSCYSWSSSWKLTFLNVWMGRKKRIFNILNREKRGIENIKVFIKEPYLQIVWPGFDIRFVVTWIQFKSLHSSHSLVVSKTGYSHPKYIYLHMKIKVRRGSSPPLTSMRLNSTWLGIDKSNIFKKSSPTEHNSEIMLAIL